MAGGSRGQRCCCSRARSAMGSRGLPCFLPSPMAGVGPGGFPRVCVPVSPAPGKALPGAERSGGSGRGAGPGALLQPGFLCSECPLNMRCHRLPLPLPAVPELHHFLSHTESACEWR